MFRVCPISDNPGITKTSQEEAKMSSCPHSLVIPTVCIGSGLRYLKCSEMEQRIGTSQEPLLVARCGPRPLGVIFCVLASLPEDQSAARGGVVVGMVTHTFNPRTRDRGRRILC